MNSLYHPFELKCFPKIKECVSRYMAESNTAPIYVKDIPIPASLEQELNEELSLYGLGPAWNFLCFKRKNYFKETTSVHVDYSAAGDVIHSSIVIPVDGCTDTKMYWVSGEYKLKQVWLDDKTSTYAVPEWTDTPYIVDRVEISEKPMLVRVDVPHSVTSRKDGTYRTILSIRLQGNPSFDEVMHKINSL